VEALLQRIVATFRPAAASEPAPASVRTPRMPWPAACAKMMKLGYRVIAP